MDYTENTAQYQLYDRILAATILNCLGEADKKEGLCLENFDPKKINHLFFFEAAMLAQVNCGIDVNLQMGLIDFYKFKWFYRRKRKDWKIKRYKKGKLTNISKILRFEAESFDVPMSTFEAIYQSYYGEDSNEDSSN